MRELNEQPEWIRLVLAVLIVAGIVGIIGVAFHAAGKADEVADKRRRQQATWTYVSATVRSVDESYSSWNGWHREFVVETDDHKILTFEDLCGPVPLWTGGRFEFSYNDDYGCMNIQNVVRIK